MTLHYRDRVIVIKIRAPSKEIIARESVTLFMKKNIRYWKTRIGRIFIYTHLRYNFFFPLTYNDCGRADGFARTFRWLFIIGYFISINYYLFHEYHSQTQSFAWDTLAWRATLLCIYVNMCKTIYDV